MIAALLAALIATPQPTPSATPLKTIVHLKSTPLCSALGRNIFHAIEGLRINDGMVTQSRLMFVKMRNDSAAGGGAMAMDNMNLQRLGSDIAHNLEGIYALLNDPAHFPKEAKTDDDHKLLAMKAQLQAVADEQQRTLNVIYGVADTYSMQEMNQRGGGMLGATGNTMKHGIYGEANPTVNFTKSVLNGGPTEDLRLQQAATYFANSPYKAFYFATLAEEVQIAKLETPAAQTIVETTNSCRG